MKRIFAIAILTTALALCYAAKPDKSVLDAVALPSVEFREAELMDVLTYLRQSATDELRPEWYRGDLPIEIRFAPSKMTAPTTLKLGRTSLQNVLIEIGKIHKISHRIEEDRVVFFDVKEAKERTPNK